MTQMTALNQIIIILLGALAGGFVSGLSGFGTGITAMGVWLYAISPPVAASLVIICSIVSQLQTFPMVWHAIQWKSVLPYIVPGLIGVPVGTILLSRIDPNLFKIGVGLFLIIYGIYALVRKNEIGSAVGGWLADCASRVGRWRSRRSGWLLRTTTDRMDRYSRLQKGISSQRPASVQYVHTPGCLSLACTFRTCDQAGWPGNDRGTAWNNQRCVAWRFRLPTAGQPRFSASHYGAPSGVWDHAHLDKPIGFACLPHSIGRQWSE